MKLRLGTDTDAKVLTQIAHDAVAASGYTEEQKASWANGLNEDRLREVLTNQFVMIVETEGQSVGFATLTDQGATAGNLDLLYVDPQFARRGVGKMLVRSIEDEARRREMTAIWVDASAPAVHRLQQLGYRIHEKYKKTLDDVVFQNTWMLKSFV
jgi:putative acetyltransferase